LRCGSTTELDARYIFPNLRQIIPRNYDWRNVSNTCIGDPRRPYPLDIEMRSGLLGKMQERHLTETQHEEQIEITNPASTEHEGVSPSVTQNGHQAVSGKFTLTAFCVIPLRSIQTMPTSCNIVA
jgi:hypothetical protein